MRVKKIEPLFFKINFFLFYFLIKELRILFFIRVCMSWVIELKSFFNPTHHGELKKKIQLNPQESGWTHGLEIFLKIIIIIIKLSI